MISHSGDRIFFVSPPPQPPKPFSSRIWMFLFLKSIFLESEIHFFKTLSIWKDKEIKKILYKGREYPKIDVIFIVKYPSRERGVGEREKTEVKLI